jgi:hypothetical protein
VAQRFLGELAAVVGPQLVELAPRMSQAGGLGHALRDQRLVAAAVITDQRASSLAQERHGVLACAAVGKVVDDDLVRLELLRAVAPQVGPVRLAAAGVERRHRHLVGMQHAMREHLRLQRIDQRLKLHPA